jgi:hypothetical protein
MAPEAFLGGALPTEGLAGGLGEEFEDGGEF